MRKTYEDMANHLKDIILPEAFENISGEENIREGVLAFRAFLFRFCDVLSAYDKQKEVARDFNNRSYMYANFPFLFDVKQILMNIGISGILSEDAQSIAIESNIFLKKLSAAKNIECMQFLTECGIQIDGIDLSKTRQKLSDIEALIITYPDNPAVLTGLKVMAVAEKEFGTNVRHNILLRCDYRAIKNDETDVISVLEDTIKPLSAKVQDYVLRLHQSQLGKGLKCVVEIKGFWIKFKYSYKRKELWGINASLNTGFQMNFKAENTQQYLDDILKFPLILQEMIAEGYGCGMKKGVSEYCDDGCKGFRIPLDDSVLSIGDSIEMWIDQELLCLQKR